MALDKYEGWTSFLAFDWSRAGLSMDLPIFAYSHTKTWLKFLSRQGKMFRAAFHIVTDFKRQTTKIESYGVLVLSGLVSVKVY